MNTLEFKNSQPKEVEVINVIISDKGIIEIVKSFVIIKGENKEEIVKRAEDYYIEQIEEQDGELNEDDKELYLENGHYELDGYEANLIWSE